MLRARGGGEGAVLTRVLGDGRWQTRGVVVCFLGILISDHMPSNIGHCYNKKINQSINLGQITHSSTTLAPPHPPAPSPIPSLVLTPLSAIHPTEGRHLPSAVATNLLGTALVDADVAVVALETLPEHALQLNKNNNKSKTTTTKAECMVCMRAIKPTHQPQQLTCHNNLRSCGTLPQPSSQNSQGFLITLP